MWAAGVGCSGGRVGLLVRLFLVQFSLRRVIKVDRVDKKMIMSNVSR